MSNITKVKRLIEKMKWKPNNSTKAPKESQAYAVGTGTYVGEMWVFVEKDDDVYHFLSIPKNINRFSPVDKFEWALKYKIAEFVQCLPADIYKICKAQFYHNKKHGNPVKSSTATTK
jgi:hypothetical protein